MFTHGISVAFRSGNHVNILHLGIPNINVFKSGTHSSNKFEVGGLLQKLLVYGKSASDHDAIIILYFIFHFFFGGSIVFMVFKS